MRKDARLKRIALQGDSQVVSMRRSVLAVGTLISALGLSLLMGPPANAAKIPIAGYPCTEKQSGKTIQTKALKAKGLSLICVADDSEHAHEHNKNEKGKHSASKMQYKWSWWSPPQTMKLDKDFNEAWSQWHAADGKQSNPSLMELLNAPYTRKDTEPCKINGLRIDEVSSVSYGVAGIFGREAPGYPSSLGRLTIGVVISVPTDYQMLYNGEAAARPGRGINYDDIRNQAANLETYLNAYFLEQSYGKLDVEFKYYPRLLRGNRSIQDMVDDDWMAPAVQAYNTANQVEDSFWESDFSDVDAIWSLIVDKPGAYAVRSFREVEGGRDDTVSLQTPIGDFRTTMQTPIPGAGNDDKPLVAHEMYHVLRLPDSYQRDSNPVNTRIAGRIGRGASGYSTSGMLGWDRYISRWLTDDNVECLTLERLENDRKFGNSGVSISLRAIQSRANDRNEKKLAVVPFNSGSQAIVVESWRPIGSDQAAALSGRPDTAQRGALVYLVNANSNNGLDVASTASDWPTIDSPYTLYRDSLWTLQPDEFPSRLTGCEEGTPSAADDNANCSVLMETQIRQEAFLREDGVRTMAIPMPEADSSGLCELNPFSPPLQQEDVTSLDPWVVLSFEDANAESDAVQVKLECR